MDGVCDLQFSLWDAAGSGSPPSGGTQVGVTHTPPPVTVTNGLFTVEVNTNNEFGGNAFTGEARWLQIAARCPAVDLSVINGRVVVSEAQLSGLDLPAAIARHNQLAHELLERAARTI